MPVYEQPKRTWGWFHYLLAGCGGCVVLAIVACFAAGFIGYFYVSKHPNLYAPNGPGSYHFRYWSQSATASLVLPEGYGTLTYGHLLLNTGGSQSARGGERALILLTNAGMPQEWPLPYSRQVAVKVDVNWHPQKGGRGPFLGLSDVTRESVLDLQRRKVGEVRRSGGKVYMADYMYNNHGFMVRSRNGRAAGGTPARTSHSAGGKPTNDLTLVLSPSNCTQLGSIVRSGNRLVFVPVSGKRP
jgi:hypothetical protein